MHVIQFSVNVVITTLAVIVLTEGWQTYAHCGKTVKMEIYGCHLRRIRLTLQVP